MSDELFNMYAEAGCPKGDIENDTVMDWAAETISALRKSREWIPAETPPIGNAFRRYFVVKMSDGYRYVAEYVSGQWYLNSPAMDDVQPAEIKTAVVSWMPLPE